MMICDMLQDDCHLESRTFRNRAYFFFMFYLHDISIQSLILVSFIEKAKLDRLREDDNNGGIREKKGRFKSKIFVNNYFVDNYISQIIY
jgi:hypothetical protein